MPTQDTSKYTVSDSPISNRIAGGAPSLNPNGGQSSFDIVKNYSWTLSPKGEARADVPFAFLTEKKLKYSALIAQGRSWLYAIQQNFSSEETNPYKYLYPADPTGFTYNLPYFSEQNRDIRNDWESSDIDLSVPYLSRLPGMAGGAFSVTGWETAAKTVFTGVGHETPRAYTAGCMESITINFVLLNTTSFEDVQQNYDFCYAFSYQNLQNRRNALLVDPPVFYTYKIPGIKYSEAAVVTNLTISNLGQTKVIGGFSDGKSKIIPEAYGISITLTDLIAQSRNLLNAMQTDNNNLVTVDDDIPPIDDIGGIIGGGERGGP